MKFIVLGTSEFTLSCAKALIDSTAEICALISMPEKILPLNSTDIKSFASNYKIPYHEFDDINAPEAIVFLEKCNPDFIFSTWPRILGNNVLDIPRRFCIGTHPADLPYNRGRHPLHWLIALGHSETKLSFFKMDSGVDSGNILLKESFPIDSTDKIDDVVNKMNSIGYDGTRKLVTLLKDNSYDGIKQNQSKANYWRKRSVHDTVLDLRMSANIILRLIRSFSPPYSCAKLIFNKYVINISDARIVDSNLSDRELERIEPGKIINVKRNSIVVKADDKIIELECVHKTPPNLIKAIYIHPPSKYITEWADIIFPQLF